MTRKGKSRNADFISIAYGNTATLGAKGPVKLAILPADKPVHLKNPLRPRIYGIPYLFSNCLYMVYT